MTNDSFQILESFNVLYLALQIPYISDQLLNKETAWDFMSAGCHFLRELTNIVRRKCVKAQEILMEIFQKSVNLINTYMIN